MFYSDDRREGDTNVWGKGGGSNIKEYKQLNDINIFPPGNPANLMDKQKTDELHAINFIKEKWCGKIKGRTCVDGSKQRSYIPKQETSSPAIGLEAFFASLLIDLFEDRSVQMFDVTGAYLHADLPKDKNMYIKFEGEFVDIMCDVNPQYAATVAIEHGKKLLYVNIKNAIYGMVESA